jgi:hypothetical protein
MLRRCICWFCFRFVVTVFVRFVAQLLRVEIVLYGSCQNKIGGAGLWDGALSSKTMWEIAGSYITYRRTALRLTDTAANSHDFTPLKYKTLMAQVNQVLKTRHDQMQRQLEHSQIPVYNGVGQFVDPHSVKVQDAHGSLPIADCWGLLFDVCFSLRSSVDDQSEAFHYRHGLTAAKASVCENRRREYLDFR